MFFCQTKSGSEESACKSRVMDLLMVVFLIALNLLVYWRSLGGYFLADDFVHVAYLQRVFAGHPELLLQNFWTNWMQTEGTQFYRPLISLTLAFDWLFWKANAFGFHLSNILYQIGSSIFLFLSTRRLLREFGDKQAKSCALFAAALFAVHPLHPEVVSWIIGRVDSVCTCFSLAAFWLFLKAKQDENRLALGAAIACFVLSLLSKEMAITLPALLFFYCLIASKSSAQPTTIFQECKNAFLATWPFWLTLGIYFIVRTLALGTIASGYTGSVGQGLSLSLWRRFVEDGGMVRVFFPFDIEVFSPFDHIRRNLKSMYIVCGILVAVRLLFIRGNSGLSRWIFFAFGWLLISLLPTYQVWNLTDNLLGSRFMYMSTAPLCLLISLFVFPLFRPASEEVHEEPTRSRLILAQRSGAAALILLVCFYATIAYKNNLTWVHAGQEVRALRQALETKVSILPEPKKLVLMNLPQRIGGAHQIYNAAMLWVLMQWPLSVNNLSPRILTFEPMMYGDSELLNIARLRKLLKSAQNYDIYVWDSQARQLELLNLALNQFSEIKLSGMTIANLKADQFLASPPLAISPIATDFVDVDLSAKLNSQTKVPPFLFLSWTSTKKPLFDGVRRLALPVQLDGVEHKYRFAVSQHKNWALAEQVNQIRIDLPTPAHEVNLSGVQFLSGERLIPKLAADESYLREDADGVSRVIREKAAFDYDASKIDGADSIVVEVSEPNSWFEHYSGEMRDQKLATHKLTQLVLKQLKGKFEIQTKTFPMPAYYQVRLACLNKQGQVIGYVSDSINLQVSELAGKKKFKLSGNAKIKRYAI